MTMKNKNKFLIAFTTFCIVAQAVYSRENIGQFPKKTAGINSLAPQKLAG